MTPIAHLCVLDDEPAALATPLADTAIPGQRAVLCGTRHQGALAERLTAVLQPRGVRCEFRPYAAGADIPALLTFFTDLLKGLAEEGFEVWLNAGTGPRRVALAAYEAARSAGQPVFAVELRGDRLVWLHPADRPAVELADKLGLREYLSLYGATVEGRKNRGGVVEAVRALGRAWAEEATALAHALATLNYLAHRARGEPPVSPVLDPKAGKDPQLRRLVADLEGCGLARWEGDRVVFTDDEARFFANGGWLEVWVYSLVRGLRARCRHIQDDGHGVEISRPVGGKPVRNELDVAFVADNKLHVIECKTKRLRDQGASDVLYKLDSLTDLVGGLNARGLLVSFDALGDHDHRRARTLGIAVVDRDELGDLEQRLRAWIEGA